jgi:hypothetical protein
MTHKRNFLKLSVFSIVIVLLLSSTAQTGTLKKDPGKADVLAPDLFQPASAKHLGLSEAQSGFFRNYELNPTTKEFDVVEIRADLLKRMRQVGFNLIPGKRIVLQRDRIETHADNYSWFGFSKDGTANAIMVIDGNEVDGNIRWEGDLYQVRSLGNGLHMVILVDQAKYPQEHPPNWHEVEHESALKPVPSWFKPNQEEISEPWELSRTASVSHTINVLVAYTSAAKSEVSNINNHIQLAIDETNQSYSNSDVNPTVSLVHKYETSYTESSDIGTDKNRFKNDGDNYMDEVHDKIDQYGADVAMLMVTEDTNACGVADTILVDDETESFAAVNQDCATGYYSFGHEIGHLQGARHDTGHDSSTTPFAYGHGYHKDAFPIHFRTVMSYSCGGILGCPRIKYWSNPNKTYTYLFWSSPMGNSSTAHNSRVLNETAAFFSSLRARAYYGDTVIFLQAPGNNTNKATSKVYISSSTLNATSTVKLVCQGHNHDRDGYARVMKVKVNTTTYTVIDWISYNQTVSNTYTISKSALNSGVNTIQAYIYWSNEDYDNGHWVSVTLRLN